MFESPTSIIYSWGVRQTSELVYEGMGFSSSFADSLFS
jgi:hypothetical protein